MASRVWSVLPIGAEVLPTRRTLSTGWHSLRPKSFAVTGSTPTRVLFIEYARSWVAERPNLRPKTVQLYTGLVERHLAPAFDTLTVQEITEPRVRRWRKSLLDAGVGEITTAKAYRLLKAIRSNLCGIWGEAIKAAGLTRLRSCPLPGILMWSG